MNSIQTFQEFLATQSAQIPLLSFVISLLLAGFLSFILARVYVKYGDALSNRKLFGRNLLLMTMTTMLIITVVKSSLALSLGLVGALSIVRFRAAIKEPEEIMYLFLAIAIGLGFGANQGAITFLAFLIIVSIIMLRKKLSHDFEDRHNLHLIVHSGEPRKIGLEQITEILKNNCSVVNLRRFDEANDMVEASFLVEFGDFAGLSKTKSELLSLGDSLKITFLDNKGIFQ